VAPLDGGIGCDGHTAHTHTKLRGVMSAPRPLTQLPRARLRQRARVGYFESTVALRTWLPFRVDSDRCGQREARSHRRRMHSREGAPSLQAWQPARRTQSHRV